ncbi:MAG: 50S ribosomal protein L29 [Gammaproteobacteria bacterium]|nr:50S ribosomal protein L29 [Gammaproteobacteria bacterium]
MKASELRAKSSDELKEELISLLREQFNLRMQKGGGQMPRPDQFQKVRKNIARVKTLIGEKRIAGVSQ